MDALLKQIRREFCALDESVIKIESKRPVSKKERTKYFQKLEHLEELIKELLVTVEPSDSNLIRYQAMLGFVYNQLSSFYLQQTNLPAACHYAEKTLELLNVPKLKMKPEVIYLVLDALNSKGVSFVLNTTDTMRITIQLHRQADVLYKAYTKRAPKEQAWTRYDIFDVYEFDGSRKKTVWDCERLNRYTSIFLYESYAKEQNIDKIIEYGMVSLKARRAIDLQDGETCPLTWIDNAVRVVIFFIGERYFKQADHILAACTALYETFKTSSTAKRRQDETKYCYGNIAIYWGHLGIEVLKASSKINDWRKMADAGAPVQDEFLDDLQPSLDCERFDDIDDIDQFEGQFPCQPFNGREDYIPIRDTAKKWIQCAIDMFPECENYQDVMYSLKDATALYLSGFFFELKVNKVREQE